MKIRRSVTLLFAACSVLTSGWHAFANADKAPRTGAETKPVLNQWLAFGSGCKKSGPAVKDGEVSLLGIKSDSTNVYRAEFKLPKFSLNAEAGAGEARLKMPKECSVRINVNPPPNKRLKMLTARTGLAISKSEKTKLTTSVRLSVGTATVGSSLLNFEPGSALSNKEEEIILLPGRIPEEVFPTLQCGEAKILGVDFTFLANRESATDSAAATLAKEKILELVVDLEDCSKAL